MLSMRSRMMPATTNSRILIFVFNLTAMLAFEF
jgi:hypothetical protein